MEAILTTPRFTVRRYTESDFEDFANLLMDPAVRVYLPQHPYEKWRSIFLDNLEACEKNPEFGRWGVADNVTGRLVGNCMLTPPREGLSGYEVGYAFEKQYWGTGAGTEIVKAIVEYALAMPEISKLYAITSTANVPSQKVLLKAGFTLTGEYVLGEFVLPLYTLKKAYN